MRLFSPSEELMSGKDTVIRIIVDETDSQVA